MDSDSVEDALKKSFTAHFSDLKETVWANVTGNPLELQIHVKMQENNDRDQFKDLQSTIQAIPEIVSEFDSNFKIVAIELVNYTGSYLPDSLGTWHTLRSLELHLCANLQSIEGTGLEPFLTSISIKYCIKFQLTEKIGLFQCLAKFQWVDSVPDDQRPRQICLPNSFCDLKNLRKIQLRYLCIPELPANFGKLEQLQILHIMWEEYGTNKLRGLKDLPASFSQLANLQKFILPYQCFKQIPDCLTRLPKLQLLDLANNQLETVPENIGSFNSLEECILRGNKLTDLPSTIQNMPKLRYLDLSRNQFELIPPWLQQNPPPKICQINFSQNPFTRQAKFPARIGELNLFKIHGVRDGDGYRKYLQFDSQNQETFRIYDRNTPSSGSDNLLKQSDIGIKLVSLHLFLGFLLDQQNYEIMVALQDEIGNLSPIDVLRNELSVFQVENGHVISLKIQSHRVVTERMFGFIGQLPRLQKLELIGLSLFNFPRELCLLKTLKTLDLSWNGLTFLPPEFGALTELEVLILSKNYFEQIPPEVQKCRALKRFEIFYNPLRALPEWLAELPALELIRISQTFIKEIPPAIEKLLRNLNAKRRPDDDAESWISLMKSHVPKKTKEIFLWREISDDLMRDYNSLKGIKSFRVGRGVYSSIIPIHPIPNLNALQFAEIHLKNFIGFPPSAPKLKLLRIVKTHLISLQGLPKSLPALTTLDIRDNPLPNLDYFPQDLPVIREIILVSNHLETLQGLPNCPTLTKLEVYQNPLRTLSYLSPHQIKLVLDDSESLIHNVDDAYPHYFLLTKQVCEWISHNDLDLVIEYYKESPLDLAKELVLEGALPASKLARLVHEAGSHECQFLRDHLPATHEVLMQINNRKRLADASMSP